jgi:hypothetical protein
MCVCLKCATVAVLPLVLLLFKELVRVCRSTCSWSQALSALHLVFVYMCVFVSQNKTKIKFFLQMVDALV